MYYEKLNRYWEKIRTNQEQYTLKNMTILRTVNLGSNFTGSFTECS